MKPCVSTTAMMITIYSRFNCKIPFLNGGLFDPIGSNGGYDWVHTDICLPDSLFSNKNKTKEGDIGDGILDIFGRYNFTVREDEPMEKEVAIDPELLGKAYEKFNAIRPDNFEEYKKALKSGKKGEESKFNKQYGVYYTPREIVHYMCQQSLINYLHTELADSNSNSDRVSNPVRVKSKNGIASNQILGGKQLSIFAKEGKQRQLDLRIDPNPDKVSSPVRVNKVSKEDIETLIHLGEQVSENEEIALIKEQKILEGKQKSSDYKLKLPESIRKNAVLIDRKLADITVCDPAVGSGAFPVGMMSEIVKARNALSVFVTQASLSACGDVQGGSLSPETLTGFQTLSGLKSDTPRTTYSFKRHCIEKSLYGVDIDPGAVEIAKLRLWLSLVVDEDDIKNIKPLPNLDYRIMQGNSLISEFMGINFDADTGRKSDSMLIKDEADELIKQFQEKKDEFLNESNVSRKTKLKEDVDNLLVEIFETKLKIQKADYFSRLREIERKHLSWPTAKERDECIKQDKEKLYKESGFNLESAEKQLKEFTSGRKIKPFFLWKLYFSEVFHEKGGFDVMIANPPYGAEIDETMLKKIKQNLVDTNNSNSAALFIDYGKNRLIGRKGTLTFIVPKSLLYSENWFSLVKSMLGNVSILVDVEKAFENVKLEQVVFVYSKSIYTDNYVARKFLDSEFIRTTKIPNDLVLEYNAWICDVSQEELDIAKNLKVECVYMKDISETKRGVGLQKYLSSEGDYPVIGGKNIFRYGCKGVKGYLSKEILKSERSKLAFMQQPKIISQDLVAHIQNPTPRIMITSFFDSTDKIIGLDTVQNTIVTNKEFDYKYILALLNSTFVSWYTYKFIYCSAIRTMHFDNYYVGKIPIPKSSHRDQLPVIALVDQIITAKQKAPDADTAALERQIDQMVYKLYDLTEEEIAIVEGKEQKLCWQ